MDGKRRDGWVGRWKRGEDSQPTDMVLPSRAAVMTRPTFFFSFKHGSKMAHLSVPSSRVPELHSLSGDEVSISVSITRTKS